MQQRLQLAPLLRRKLVNGGLDFSNRAHARNLNAEPAVRQIHPRRGGAFI
jgi:hypothetical protein